VSVSLSRVVIVHGYSATPADHWFGSLAEAMERAGVAVQVPALPNPGAPNLERWTTAVGRAIGDPDEGTGIVTHSLGGVTTLRALDLLSGPWRLGALIAVAGFVSPLPRLPELDSFTAVRPDVERTATRTAHRSVLLSDNDTYVPAAHTAQLGRALRAETIAVPGAGHILADEGVTTLPQVAERLLAL